MWTNIRWGVLYKNDATHCMLYVERQTEPVWHFYDHALAPLVPRPSPWRSKRPSSSTPTCWWQKQWLSGKQSLPLRSCSRKHRYVTLGMVKTWSELHEDSTSLCMDWLLNAHIRHKGKARIPGSDVLFKRTVNFLSWLSIKRLRGDPNHIWTTLKTYSNNKNSKESLRGLKQEKQNDLTLLCLSGLNLDLWCSFVMMDLCFVVSLQSWSVMVAPETGGQERILQLCVSCPVLQYATNRTPGHSTPPVYTPDTRTDCVLRSSRPPLLSL